MFKKLIYCLPLIMTTCGVTAKTQQPSFDCAKASIQVEHLICSNGDLADLDVQLSNMYKAAKSNSVDKPLLTQEQLNWIKSRNVCESSECVKLAYQNRIVELDAFTASNIETESVASSVHDETVEIEQAEDQATAYADSTSSDESSVVKETNSPTNQPTPSASKEIKPSESIVVSQINTPDAGAVSIIARIGLNIATLLFLIGMIKPRWILRKFASPTRKQLFIYYLVIALPLGGVSELTKSKEFREYQSNILAKEKADAEAKAKAKAAIQAENHRKKIEQVEEKPISEARFTQVENQEFCKSLAFQLVMTATLPVSNAEISRLIDDNMDTFVENTNVQYKNQVRQYLSHEMHKALPSSRAKIVSTVNKFGNEQAIYALSNICIRNMNK